MKLFKRRPWITIWSSWEYSMMIGREKIISGTYVQVKEKINGTYKVRAYVKNERNEFLVPNFNIDYLRYKVKDNTLDLELKRYGII